MKIGIISDVHANIAALEKALHCLDHAQVESIVCAGDLVEKGSDGDAVVRLMRKRQIPTVRGNHDEQAIDNQRWLRNRLSPENLAVELARLASGQNTTSTALLTDETIAYLKKLPFSKTFTLNEKTIFLGHGTPDSNSQYAFAHSLPTLWWRIIHVAQADVIILGHTHEPMWMCVGKTTVINPGSTCCNYEFDHGTCAVLDLETLQPTFLNVDNCSVIEIPKLLLDDL